MFQGTFIDSCRIEFNFGKAMYVIETLCNYLLQYLFVLPLCVWTLSGSALYSCHG